MKTLPPFETPANGSAVIKPAAKNRQANMELLRILSMLMIIVLHCLGKSGILKAEAGAWNMGVTWFLEALCAGAVNVYILISGYFSVRSVFKIKKIFMLWLQVAFYSVWIYAILAFLKIVPLKPLSIIKAVLPVSSAAYWFVTAFIGLYILSPFLNTLIHNLSKKKFEILLITAILLFSVWPTVYPLSPVLDKAEGYGIIWFVCLYSAGAYHRVYGMGFFKKKTTYLVGYFTAALLSFAVKTLLDQLVVYSGGFDAVAPNFLYNYNSVTTFAGAVFLFVFFSKVEINAFKKLILSVSPLTFGVYLIHDNNALRGYLWRTLDPGRFLDNWYYPFAIMGIVISVFVLCCAVDYPRIILFNQINKLRFIDRVCKKAESAVYGLASRVFRN